jgi:hypothetical protein
MSDCKLWFGISDSPNHIWFHLLYDTNFQSLSIIEGNCEYFQDTVTGKNLRRRI